MGLYANQMVLELINKLAGKISEKKPAEKKPADNKSTENKSVEKSHRKIKG